MAAVKQTKTANRGEYDHNRREFVDFTDRGPIPRRVPGATIGERPERATLDRGSRIESR